MTTQRLISRLNVSEKVKTELLFVGQCIAAAGILVVAITFAVGH
jgi:hypothetical protein